MCGIIGYFGDGPFLSPNRALKSILHRGPDAQDHIVEEVGKGHLFLGHTRLSILELSEAGAQPMHSRDGRWLLTYNGEIYNHEGLRNGLKGPFAGRSDTETLVESIAQRGLDETLNLIDGMVAFAAYDRKERQLHLYRDPFGIKPLYFMEHEGSFLFSSEIRGLASFGVPLSLDNKGIDSFLTLRYCPSPQTLLRDVQRLPPGHLLSRNLQTGKNHLRWMASSVPVQEDWNYADALSAYTEGLKASIHRQLMSDVPVGLLLSGGIDSALVAAMAKESGVELQGFTVGFGNHQSDCEIDDATHTAHVLGLPHSSIVVDPESLWNDFSSIISAVEEPLGTTSVLPMWRLTQRARQDVTVVLTGQGSDEPWGGYRRYQMELIRQKGPKRFWSALSFGQRLAEGSTRLPEYIRRGLRSVPIAEESLRFLAAYEMFSPADRMALTGRSDSDVALGMIRQWIARLTQDQLKSTELMMRIDSRMNLADDLLLYGDKISMAFALEARVPMLDLQLMRLIESFPLRFKASLGKTKILHKAAAEAYLPSEIVHRPKKGFQVPFGDWSRGVWKDRLADLLLAQGSRHHDVLNRDHLMRLWAAHQAGSPDMSRHIFALSAFALWMRWLDEINS